MRNIGKRIKRLRELRNLTQQQLAEMVGTDRSNIAKIETGQSPGSIPLLDKIATALEVTISELLGESDGHVA